MKDEAKTKDQLLTELAALRDRLPKVDAGREDAGEVEASLARLATFPEQNPNPVIETDLDGKVTYQNPIARARFPDIESVGLEHPILNDLSSIIKTLREGDGDSLMREIVYDDRTYEQKTIYLAQNSLVRIFAYDVTELKRFQASLARLATFPEQNPNPVIETDLEGNVTFVNPAARDHFPGLEVEAIEHPVLQDVETIIQSTDRSDDESLLRELDIGDRTYQQKTTYMGQNRLVRIYAHDITELKRLQAELENSLAELERTNQSLEDAQQQLIESEKMAALGGLVAGIAHEINTPVGISVTAASHLQGRTLQFEEAFSSGQIKKSDLESFVSAARESSDLILGNLERAAEIISSFKQVAVDQSNEEKRKFEVKSYLEEIVLSLRPELRRTKIDVVVEGPGDIVLDTFPGALSQIVTNFIMNSLLHAYDEGDVGTIHLRTKERDGWWIMTYTDDGKGIPAELVSKVFDPFFTTKRNQGGSGLGLHIVYNIVTQRLKGTLEVQSVEGKGTTFIISLPIEELKGTDDD